MKVFKKTASIVIVSLFISLLPLGLFFIFTIDRKNYDSVLNSKQVHLDQILSSVNSDFAAYAQLLTTMVDTIGYVPRERDSMEHFMKDVFNSAGSNLFYGIGIWFEPYAFSPEERLYGPYISFKIPGKGEVELTHSWNTDEYNYVDQDWYQFSLQTARSNIYISPPYFDTDYTYITFGKPFFLNNVPSGVVTIDIVYPQLEGYFKRFDLSGFEAVYLVSSNGDIILREEAEKLKDQNRENIPGNTFGQILEGYENLSERAVVQKSVSADDVITLYGVSDRKTIIGRLIKSNSLNYIIYCVFWFAMLIGGSLWLSGQRRAFANKLLNSENEKLKLEIQRREKAEEQIRYLAYHDPISGLKNLNAYYEEVAEPVKGSDKRAAILISLDNFKALTALMDRGIIDHLLRAFSERLIRLCPPETSQYRGRGFSYYIICRNEPEETAFELAQTLASEFKKSFEIHSINLRIRVSIGIAYFHEAENLEEVLNMTESAVTENSEKTGGEIRSFDRSLQEKLSRIISLDAAMSHKDFINELHLLYQPIVRMDSREIIGMEALIRWNCPLFEEPVGPDEFITIAEENSFIIELGWLVISSALRLLSKDLKESSLFITVNVSPVQLLEVDFTSRLEELMKAYSVPRARIKLEITESSGSAAVPYFWTIIQELIEKGYKLVIDDFGTGESSFHRLHDMAFDTLKIDKSFVRNIHRDKRSLEIFRSLLQLSRSMNSTVIAEGIETPEEHETLRAIGIEYAQGYLYGRPGPFESLQIPLKKKDTAI